MISCKAITQAMFVSLLDSTEHFTSIAHFSNTIIFNRKVLENLNAQQYFDIHLEM